MELTGLLFGVAGILVIALTTALADRLRLAGPLLLVAIGIGVGVLPFVEVPEIPPEWILEGVLPPLLYAAAVRLPALEFRRDLGRIAGLSVLLVVVSALVLGLFFWAVIPGIPFALAVALGAILSPTDAVATSIVKPLGIPRRVVTLLDGESLLNDATSLVLLRTAVAAIAGGFAFGSTVLAFGWSVLIAVLIGGAAGYLNLRVRGWVRNPAASTAISFTIPFLASVPAEAAGGSGLVAAVVAGIVTAQGATRYLDPGQRLAEQVNWRTVELVLEGAVFLVMGLELKGIVEENLASGAGLWQPVWLALVALLLALAVRALWVTGLVGTLRWRERRMDRGRLEALDERLRSGKDSERTADLPPRWREVLDAAADDKRKEGLRGRVRTALNDFDYYASTSIDARQGAVIVWAGMRGVVTLAAAQTLPRDDDATRALLVFVAFLVAAFSLGIQGSTLPWLVRRLRLGGAGDAVTREDQERMDAELRAASVAVLSSGSLRRRDGTAFDPDTLTNVEKRFAERPPDADMTEQTRIYLELRIAMIEAMRERVRALSRDGSFPSELIRRTQQELDADQLSIELKLADGR